MLRLSFDSVVVSSIQQAGPVEAGHLDHGVAVRPLIVDGDFRLDRERLQPRPWRPRAWRPPPAAAACPRSTFSIDLADARGAARLVLVAIEFARDRDGVERAAVGGGVDLRVDDVGAGRRAGAGDDRQQPGMVGRQDGQLGHAARLVEADIDRERCGRPVRLARRKRAWRDLARQIDLEPVGRIVPRDIGVELGSAASR